MAQGKIKVKSNQKPPPKKNKQTKSKGVVKKGKFTFAAKNQTKLQIQKFKKAVTKDINTKIETELKAIALKQHEGKEFHTLSTNTIFLQPGGSKKK